MVQSESKTLGPFDGTLVRRFASCILVQQCITCSYFVDKDDVIVSEFGVDIDAGACRPL